MPTTTRSRSRSIRRLLPLAALATLALGACSTGGEDALRDLPDAAGVEAAAEAAADDVDGAGGPQAPGGVDLTAVTDGRQIISTAHVDLTADDAEIVVGRIGDIVAEAGGFVSGEDTSRVAGTRTTMVLRVPPEAFDGVLDSLAGLGELTAQRIETDEVTEQVVDLESRITTAEVSVGRLRALLEGTGSVADIAQVEAELLLRETTLETLRGQLRTIERQVELATITVDVESDDAAPVVDEQDGPSFLGGLTAGWDALVLTFSGAAALLGVLLPWTIVLALVGVPAWRVIRSRRRPTPAGA